MNLSSRQKLVEALIPIIRKAGAVVHSLQKSELAPRSKSDGSPVTIADLASHDILCGACRALSKTIPILSEEDESSATTALNTVAFAIDPLDGTKEYIRGRDEFTVNIALVENGHATAGLIHAPARGRLFFSYGSGYAFEETPDGRRRNLGKQTVPPRQPIVLVSRSHLDRQTKDLLAALRPCTVREVGSSLKFALIAAAEADAYIRLSPTMLWDCAAGIALVEAAGGFVRRTDGSPLLEARSRTLKIDGFVAGRTPQLAQWIETAQKTIPFEDRTENR